MKTHLFIEPKARANTFENIIAFDTEALIYEEDYNKQRQVFFNIDFFDGNKHAYFEDLSKAYLWIYNTLQEKKKITFIAHNIGYDIQIIGLLKYVFERNMFGLPLKVALIDSVKYIKFSGDGYKLEFLDTFNYVKKPLKDIAEKMGMEKLDIEEYELANKNPSEWNKAIKKDGEQRAKIDTEILWKFFTQFVGDKNFIMGITMASTAFKALKGNWLKRQISMPIAHIDYALNAYRGGRCEPYIINEKPVYLKSYDINSLYPFVMKVKKYSYKFHREVDKINYDAIENENYNYFYNVDYSYPLQDAPYRLPIMVRRKSDMSLVQSYQASNVWLTGAEILEMYKQYDNILFTFRNGLEYHNDYLFSDFVDYFYNLRKNSTNELDKFDYKIFLNSSYGKMGQHRRISNFYSYSEIPEEIKGLMQDEYQSGHSRITINNTTYSLHDIYVSTQTDLPIAQMNNPFIASEITANARLYNFQIQNQIGFNHVYYTDTDSFFIDRDWTESNELGKLKNDKKGYFVIRDAKDYYYQDDKGNVYSTLKGIAKKSIKQSDSFVMNYNIEHHTNFNEIYSVKNFSNLKTKKPYDCVIVSQSLKGIEHKRKKLSYKRDNNMLIGYPFNNVD